MTEKDKQLPNDTEQQEPPQADSKRGYDLANRAGVDLAKEHAARIVRIDKAFQPTAALSAIAKSMQDSGYSKMLAAMAESSAMLKPPVGGWALEHVARIARIDKAFQPTAGMSAMVKSMQDLGYSKMLAAMAESSAMLKPLGADLAKEHIDRIIGMGSVFESKAGMKLFMGPNMLEVMPQPQGMMKLFMEPYADSSGHAKILESMSASKAMVKALQDQQDQISRIEKMVGSLSVHNSDFTEVQEAFQEANKLTESFLRSAAADNRAISKEDLDKAVKKIAISGILIAIISFVLTSILHPIIEYEVKQYIETDKNNWKRAVDNVQIQDRDLLRPYRIVTADVLNVRQSASAKSPIMGQLHYGDVVQIVEKRRSWSFIIWRDMDSDSLIQGWVFTRYIKPLK